MPTWLILAWSITLGYNPSFLANDMPKCNDAIIAEYFTSDLAFSFSAFNHLRIFTDWESFVLRNASMLASFFPYRIDYIFGIALYEKGFELGIKHECGNHPVIFSSSQLYYPSHITNETSLYLRLSGQIN